MTLQEADKKATSLQRFKGDKFSDGSIIFNIILAPQNVFFNDFIIDLFNYYNYPDSANAQTLRSLKLDYDILLMILKTDGSIIFRWARDLYPSQF